MKNNEEVCKLIQNAGGPVYVANQLGVPVSTINIWMMEGTVPSPKYRLQLIKLVERVREYQ